MTAMNTSRPVITPTDFTTVCELVRSYAGIAMEADRSYLAESRLGPIAAANKATLGELAARLRAEPFGELHVRVVEAMLITETSFFRDAAIFSAFEKRVLPEVIQAAAGRDIHVWCGACATGQEPYSIAMLLHERFAPSVATQVVITASDISEASIDYARRAMYSQIEVNRGLPAPFLLKYFEHAGNRWRLRDWVRKGVNLRKINLSQSLPLHVDFDVIFLRNVLIYFDIPSKKLVLERVRNRLRPGGYLILGTAESTLMLHDGFEPVQLDKAVCFRRRRG
jgi:chemotaxis protein methyltransferase CheR